VDKYHVNVTETAFEDLAAIARYVKEELKEPAIAEKLTAKLKKAVFSLETSPRRYALLRDAALAARGYRGVFVDNYAVFYIVAENGKTVDVSRVLYARRNWIDLLQSE
jgi:toxin ParE1/3/4